MYQVEDEPIETIHVYVVREEQKRSSLAPVIISFLALSILIAIGVLTPYQQPEIRTAIRVPAVLLPLKTFTTDVTVIPTGSKTFPATTAHGTLTLTNGSVISEELPQGLIFTGNNGIEVVTDTAVLVPAGSANGYGVATVSAHALVSGLQGNIQAFAVNLVYGTALYVRNLTPFARGRNTFTETFITEQDRQHALSQARERLTQKIVARLLSQPCAERVTGTLILIATWTCQFVTYETPQLPHIRVLHAEVAGKSIILTVVFVERPRRYETK